MLIKQIGLCAMTLTLPMTNAQTVTQQFSQEQKVLSKTNIVIQQEYNQDNTLKQYYEYSTIQYEQAKLGNLLTCKTRAISEVVRRPYTNVYSVQWDILTEIQSNGITVNNSWYGIEIVNIPYQSYITQGYPSITGYSYTTLTQDQQDFINGKNYEGTELLNLNLREGATARETEELRTLNPGTQYSTARNTNYNYYLTSIEIIYEDLTDEGTNLLNNTSMFTFSYYSLYTATYNENNYEVIDIPGLMFDILGMPFAWVSIAFNFTLFPGTPYEINISHLLLALLVSLIAIIIFRIIWGKK